MKYLFQYKPRWPRLVALGVLLGGMASLSAYAQQVAGCTYPNPAYNPGQAISPTNQPLVPAYDASQPISATNNPSVVSTPYNGTWTPPLGAAGYNPNVNYCVPNFAVSPPLRKFKDAMAGLTAANQNGLGQYIPVAVSDPNKFPGSDYYEIGLKQYQEQMHSDLPTKGSGVATRLRGYYQKNQVTGIHPVTGVLNGTPTVQSDNSNHYLGPMIVARRGRAVRVKFFNELPLSGTGSDLFLPIDRNLMGAGLGRLAPDGVTACDPMIDTTCASYSDNRAVIHMHGGLTPWISDGTPHQWITPAGESSVYKKGDSFQNVPDMIGSGGSLFPPALNDGVGTYYYTNNQSGRLLFYHDHTLGLTRLNVYAGMAAPYLIVDPVEDTLITAGVLPGQADIATGTTTKADVYKYGIPLVIQDKSFVNGGSAGEGANGNATPNGAPTNGATAGMPSTKDADPLWFKHVANSRHGDLWLPHEYLPNEDPFNTWYDPGTNSYGANPMGRWDYSPWMNPPGIVMNDVLPSPTAIPETYGDTMLVNGTAFPYMDLPPTAARFRVLNASNDRFLNLQLYYASKPDGTLCKSDGVHPIPRLEECTEVSMIPALDYPTFFKGAPVNVGGVTVDSGTMPAAWPTDGRAGGVPYWGHSGPDILQIGNEAGFLAQVAQWPSQPVDFDHNTRSVTLNGITSRALMLPSAVRADVIVDFSGVPSGSALIMYNDAPAPMPLWDNRNDYYTNDGDQTGAGGAPNTEPGYGPNTRTVMQFRIAGTPAATFDVAKLKLELPKAFKTAQKPPHVPQTFYPDANGVVPNTGVMNVYANVADESLNVSGTVQPISRVVVTAPGQGYTRAPTVKFSGGSCKDSGGNLVFPTATASLNGVTGLNLLTGGTGYNTKPTVTITPAAGGGGTGATADVTVTGGIVTGIYVTNPGSGYLLPPTVTIAGGGGTGATATSNVFTGSVGSITLGGNAASINCLTAPLVTLVPGKGNPGTGATAVTTLANSLVLDGKNLIEGFDREYGRMDAMLGSTPNPLTPVMGAGPVVGVAYYVDPPTEILTGNTTYLWRIMHIGVDSHAIHFHLFDVQLINRVDWTGVIKPPFADELGWKETVRTNPFEDIIVALQPSATDMSLPFTIPNSLRLLDPTVPAGSTGIFSPVAPPPGVMAVAQSTNVINNFGWEYVWHCHLLGHEENDMMRPIVFFPEMPTGGLNPQALTFAGTAVGGTSATQTVTLTNSGVSTLLITGIDLTASTTSTDFQRATPNGGTCPTNGSLLPTASCTIIVVFKPTTSGAITGTLTVTDNSMGRVGAKQTVLLSGTGNAPATTISTQALNFGTVNTLSTSAAQMVTITNTGLAALNNIVPTISLLNTDYAIVQGVGSCVSTLAAGQSCNVYVTFTPTTTLTRNGTLSIATAIGTNTVSLTGVGANVPMATVSLASLAFGTVKLGQNPAAQTVTVTNTGGLGTTLHVAMPTTSAPFAVTAGANVVSNACSLAPNASCSFNVSYTPTAVGVHSANLQLMTNSNTGSIATVTPQVVALTGTAAVPQAQLTTTASTFGPAAMGSTTNATATLTNTSTVPMLISSIAMQNVSGTSNVLTQTNNCPVSPNTLAAAASCTITLAYKPTVGSSTDKANLVVTDDSGGVLNTQQTIQLTGTSSAPSPIAGLSGTLSFGTGLTGVGAKATKVATLTNSGTAALNIASIVVAGASYTQTNTCLAALPVGQSCTITVQFAPTVARRAYSGTLTVTDDSNNVANSKQTLAISGTSK